MPIYPDIQAAIPPDGGGPVGKTLLRNAVTARMPYILADDENPSDLVCVDPVTGAGIIDILYLGRLFHYDPTDSITDPDGVSCIVSNEGRRYKLSDGADVFAYSVLDNSLTAPPVSPAPSIGDAYLVAPAATGDWAGHDNEVGVLTARGWEFINFGIGRLLYIESLEAYVHRKSTGDWAFGFGNLTIGANSVPLSAAINFGNRVRVENITTTSPPGTAAVGTAYLIGGSATGSWSGQDGKIAICEVANTFTIYTPVNGLLAFDKSSGTEYRYNGSAWISADGSWIDRKATAFTVSGSTTAPTGTTFYVNSSGTAPTTSQRRIIDNVTIAFAAKKAGAVLRFHYRASYSIVKSATGGGASDFNPTYALFRDAGSNAIDWSKASDIEGTMDVWFEVAAPDAGSHTYTFAVMSGYDLSNSTSSHDYNSLVRRLFTVEEAA